MPHITKKTTSITTFVNALMALKKGGDDVFWFRGQAQEEWELLPGFSRIKSPPPETNLFNEFRQSAAMLAEFTPRESFDWLMLMQHYGVPTRLLDWAENPMIALYFALASRSSHKGKDAAFWLLRPTELNRHSGIDDDNDKNYLPSFQDDEPKPYSIEYLRTAPKTQLLPIAAIAVRNNSRIQAQSGVFTVHHLKNIPIEQIGDEKHIIKYVIPHDKKELIACQLETLASTGFTFFQNSLRSVASLRGNTNEFHRNKRPEEFNYHVFIFGAFRNKNEPRLPTCRTSLAA